MRHQYLSDVHPEHMVEFTRDAAGTITGVEFNNIFRKFSARLAEGGVPVLALYGDYAEDERAFVRAEIERRLPGKGVVVQFPKQGDLGT